MLNRWLFLFLLALLVFVPASPAPGSLRPNILWITAEDIGPHLKCYGFDYADTPQLDAFAARSLRYRRCWSNAPVCAPARTTLITGMYPTSLGAEHMRSEVRLPPFVQLFPELLRKGGYYCTNNAKTDYNLAEKPSPWDVSSNVAHYRDRPAGKPFFAVFNITVTHESQLRKRPHHPIHDPAMVPLPAYHPDIPEVRQDWAQYHDNITTMDGMVGKHLAELQSAGLEEETIVFFYGDHGSGMPRSKRWPYNSGLHVPLIVHIPEKFRSLAPAGYQPGAWSGRLVSFVDFAPTLLSLAGAKPAVWHQGRAFLGPAATAPAAPEYLFGFRGRMDERTDTVRSLTDGRFIYIRNYLPHLIYGQHLDYMFQTPTTRLWKELYDAGKLSPPQTCFWEKKPAEELYDLQADPDEVKNLATISSYASRLLQYRTALKKHLVETRDTGFLGESEMLRRAGKDPVHTMAQDELRYPILEILSAADAASLPAKAGVDRTSGLKAPDPAIRYWALLGLQIDGKETALPLKEAIRPLLNDPSPSVQIAAAELLADFSGLDETVLAVRVLKALAPSAAAGPLVSLEALSALGRLGSKAGNLNAFYLELNVKSPGYPPRYREYAPRMLQDLQ